MEPLTFIEQIRNIWRDSVRDGRSSRPIMDLELLFLEGFVYFVLLDSTEHVHVPRDLLDVLCIYLSIYMRLFVVPCDPFPCRIEQQCVQDRCRHTCDGDTLGVVEVELRKLDLQ